MQAGEDDVRYVRIQVTSNLPDRPHELVPLSQPLPSPALGPTPSLDPRQHHHHQQHQAAHPCKEEDKEEGIWGAEARAGGAG